MGRDTARKGWVGGVQRDWVYETPELEILMAVQPGPRHHMVLLYGGLDVGRPRVCLYPVLRASPGPGDTHIPAVTGGAAVAEAWLLPITNRLMPFHSA